MLFSCAVVSMKFKFYEKLHLKIGIRFFLHQKLLECTSKYSHRQKNSPVCLAQYDCLTFESCLALFETQIMILETSYKGKLIAFVSTLYSDHF